MDELFVWPTPWTDFQLLKLKICRCYTFVEIYFYSLFPVEKRGFCLKVLPRMKVCQFSVVDAVVLWKETHLYISTTNLNPLLQTPRAVTLAEQRYMKSPIVDTRDKS